MSQASPIAERLSRYAYSPFQGPSRRRPRPLPVKEEVASSSDSEGSGDNYDSSPSESDAEAPRERATKRRADGTVIKYGWPKDVKVAHPSKYEDYPELDDLLRPGLDLVFIGINPGKKSSLEGHFFAHSTNKFWRSLYGSGLTPRLFTPYEDLKLPDQCNIGLTNLVDRCTSMASELSALEQRIAVYPLAKKLSENGPKVACFVGKGIWQQFESIVKKSATPASASSEAVNQEDEAGPSQGTNRTPRVIRYSLRDGQVTEDQTSAASSQVKAEPDSPLSSSASAGEVEMSLLDDGLDEPITPMRNPRSPTITPTPRQRKGKGKAKATPKPKPPKKPFLWDAPQMYRLPSTAEGGYTYLWVVPNTSGLERSTLGEQIEHFSALKRLVDRRRNGEGPLAPDEDGNEPPPVDDVFWNIDLDAVKQTCEDEKNKRSSSKKRK